MTDAGPSPRPAIAQPDLFNESTTTGWPGYDYDPKYALDYDRWTFKLPPWLDEKPRPDGLLSRPSPFLPPRPTVQYFLPRSCMPRYMTPPIAYWLDLVNYEPSVFDFGFDLVRDDDEKPKKTVYKAHPSDVYVAKMGGDSCAHCNSRTPPLQCFVGAWTPPNPETGKKCSKLGIQLYPPNTGRKRKLFNGEPLEMVKIEEVYTFPPGWRRLIPEPKTKKPSVGNAASRSVTPAQPSTPVQEPVTDEVTGSAAPSPIINPVEQSATSRVLSHPATSRPATQGSAQRSGPGSASGPVTSSAESSATAQNTAARSAGQISADGMATAHDRQGVVRKSSGIIRAPEIEGMPVRIPASVFFGGKAAASPSTNLASSAAKKSMPDSQSAASLNAATPRPTAAPAATATAPRLAAPQAASGSSTPVAAASKLGPVQRPAGQLGTKPTSKPPAASTPSIAAAPRSAPSTGPAPTPVAAPTAPAAARASSAFPRVPARKTPRAQDSRPKAKQAKAADGANSAAKRTSSPGELPMPDKPPLAVQAKSVVEKPNWRVTKRKADSLGGQEAASASAADGEANDLVTNVQTGAVAKGTGTNRALPPTPPPSALMRKSAASNSAGNAAPTKRTISAAPVQQATSGTSASVPKLAQGATSSSSSGEARAAVKKPRTSIADRLSVTPPPESPPNTAVGGETSNDARLTPRVNATSAAAIPSVTHNARAITRTASAGDSGTSHAGALADLVSAPPPPSQPRPALINGVPTAPAPINASTAPAFTHHASKTSTSTTPIEPTPTPTPTPTPPPTLTNTRWETLEKHIQAERSRHARELARAKQDAADARKALDRERDETVALRAEVRRLKREVAEGEAENRMWRQKGGKGPGGGDESVMIDLTFDDDDD